MRPLLLVTILLLSILLAGCAPYISKYRYISLEAVVDISVKKTAMPRVNNLSLAREMPLEYELQRKAYLLAFQIDDNAYMANITVEAFDLAQNQQLLLKQQRFRMLGQDKWQQHCSPSYLMDTPTAIEVVWPSCNTPKKGWFISFDVLDGNKVIGSEDIAFTLTENGIYYVIDGI